MRTSNKLIITISFLAAVSCATRPECEGGAYSLKQLRHMTDVVVQGPMEDYAAHAWHELPPDAMREPDTGVYQISGGGPLGWGEIKLYRGGCPIRHLGGWET